MTVLDIDQALVGAQRTAEKLGGYLHGIENTVIDLRVPVARFHDALDRLSVLGTVTSRRITADDITEEMFDLELRLKTAREMRDRLAVILERAESVTDALAVEKELGRVLTEIERLEGRIRFLREQVSFSSISVRFNAAVSVERARQIVPFLWVRDLADQLDQPTVSAGRVRGRPPIDLPEGFVRYYQNENTMDALSADGLGLRVPRTLSAVGKQRIHNRTPSLEQGTRTQTRRAREARGLTAMPE
jgi:hypothetical protein